MGDQQFVTAELDWRGTRAEPFIDIIQSKRATGRRRDLAVLDILQRTLDEQKNIGQ